MTELSDYRRWRKAVVARDGGVCQRCGSEDCPHAHHIKHRKTHPEFRFFVENGITLCRRCHKAAHPEQANWVGMGMLGKRHTPAARSKMSASHKGLPTHGWSAESRARLSASKMGHPVSEAAREALRVANIGRTPPRYSPTPEQRARISASLRGNHNGAGNKGRVASLDTRKKQSEGAKRFWALKRNGAV